MPGDPRNAPGGVVFHGCNRGVGRAELFHKDADYAALERILAEGVRRFAMRVLDYCLMPYHWHLVARPREEGTLSPFMRRVTAAYTR